MVQVLREFKRRLAQTIQDLARLRRANPDVSEQSEQAVLRAYWEFCYPFARGNDPLFPAVPELPAPIFSAQERLLAAHRKNSGLYADVGEQREAFFTTLVLLQDPPAVTRSALRQMSAALATACSVNPHIKPRTEDFSRAVQNLQAYWELRSEALLNLGSIARRDGEAAAAEEGSVHYALRHAAANRDEFIAIHFGLFDAVPIFLLALDTLLVSQETVPDLPIRRLRLLRKSVALHLSQREELRRVITQLANRIFAD